MKNCHYILLLTTMFTLTHAQWAWPGFGGEQQGYFGNDFGNIFEQPLPPEFGYDLEEHEQAFGDRIEPQPPSISEINLINQPQLEADFYNGYPYQLDTFDGSVDM
ncbi:uncharacterized protein LOC132798365 [Drosophila nasuta]|uniref:uncharacterized protein LOC132798365 n=1 Tax=Drosophila nasuta TaxID=42062 RepID=UPI00295F532B|nr:uncharacterized protein LOC132798365 [Drosophila nasuta]